MSHIIEIEVKLTTLRTGLQQRECLLRIWEREADEFGRHWYYEFTETGASYKLSATYSSFRDLRPIEVGYAVLSDVLQKSVGEQKDVEDSKHP